jgi:hypothetical protein
MRAKIAKAVREVFASKLRQEIPQFVLVETQRTRPGDRLFSWRMNSDASAYIYLFISPKYNQDRFSVELACSAGEFPMQMPRQPNSGEQNGPIRFRLPQLYKDQWPKKNWEPMWEVGPHDTPREAISRVVVPRHEVGKIQERLLPIEQAIELVEPQVQDAIDKIRRFGIPFFQKFGGQNSGQI